MTNLAIYHLPFTKLAKARATPTIKQMKTTTPKKEESTDTILNRLISGNGVKRRRKIM